MCLLASEAVECQAKLPWCLTASSANKQRKRTTYESMCLESMGAASVRIAQGTVGGLCIMRNASRMLEARALMQCHDAY